MKSPELYNMMIKEFHQTCDILIFTVVIADIGLISYFLNVPFMFLAFVIVTGLSISTDIP